MSRGTPFAFRYRPQANEEVTELPSVVVHPRETPDEDDGLPTPVKSKGTCEAEATRMRKYSTRMCRNPMRTMKSRILTGDFEE